MVDDLAHSRLILGTGLDLPCKPILGTDLQWNTMPQGCQVVHHVRDGRLTMEYYATHRVQAEVSVSVMLRVRVR